MSDSLFSDRPSSSYCCTCYSSMSIGRWGLERKTNVHPSPITTNETMTVILINQWWWSYSSIDYSQGTVDTQTLKKSPRAEREERKGLFQDARPEKLSNSLGETGEANDWLMIFFPLLWLTKCERLWKGNRILKREERTPERGGENDLRESLTCRVCLWSIDGYSLLYYRGKEKRLKSELSLSMIIIINPMCVSCWWWSSVTWRNS